MTEDLMKPVDINARKAALLARMLGAQSARARQERIPRRQNLDVFPLSSGQKRMWLLDQMEVGTHYNEDFDYRLKGTVDVPVLKRSLQEIFRRHEAMRSTFSLVDGQLVQQLVPAETLELPVIDLRSIPEPEREAEVTRISVERSRKPFDLSKGPLWRFTLLFLDESNSILLATVHHVAVDGWSTGVFLNELLALYEAFLAGKPSPLPEPAIQYADYAAWQAEWMTSDAANQQRAYWTQHLAGAPQLLELPADHPRPQAQMFDGTCYSLAMPKHFTSDLKALSAREGVTLFMTLVAIFDTLIKRYTDKDDIVIGTPVANRSRAEIEGLIGFFVNTIALRNDLSGDPSFSELLKRVRQTTLGGLANQDLPFEQLVELLHAERSKSHTPLFQVLLVFQNTPTPASEIPGLSVTSFRIPNGTSKFDLSLFINDTPEGLSCTFEYNTDLFDADRIERMAGHLRVLMESVVRDPSRRLSELPILTAEERDRLLVKWNDTAFEYPKDVPIARLVEAQVDRTPDATAVVYGGESLTYRQLNVRANRLAHKLVKLGAGPDQLVALFVERSTDLIVALLAIVKTGAGYLPLDPLFPAERLGYMLEDSGARLLITQQSLRRDLPEYAGAIIQLEDEDWQAEGCDNPAIEVRPEHLAYQIYTSGSTGKPKGVQIPRGALTNLLWSMREWLKLSDRDRLLAVSTISFDIAAADVWLPLLVGAHAVVASRETAADGNALRALLERHDITFLQATPVTWRLLFDAGWPGKPDLQAVCTGEAMPQEVAAKLVPVVKRVWNLYGPTETTIWSTGYEVTDGGKPILIGRPVANTQCYILDGHGQPVPIGVTGELYIAGDGLARGYLNRPELTAEKFIADPFHPGDAKMYRTGDLARYRTDGNIECLGRIDHQVKIRGYRIELGEIEAVLKSQPEIKQAVVVVREDSPGDKRLVAYYTVDAIGQSEDETIGAEQFRGLLSKNLPEYMVPAAYVRLDEMPLTPNGKLDRKALPAPEGAAYSTSGYEPPQGELETKLAAIWADVLKLDRVGRHDNFFDLGGHSLLAVQLILRLQEMVPGEPLPMRAVLEAPTVEQFAVWISDHRSEEENKILVRVRKGTTKRTPFFLIHGAGGNVLSMRPLAMALPNELPVYFLQAKGLDGSAPFESVEETAQCYVDEIRRVQPHGPYYLGGGCYGGVVAFEMARVLDQLGERVAALILIDAWNPAFGKSLPKGEKLLRNVKFFVKRAGFHSRRMLAMPPGEMLDYTRGRFKALRKYFSGLGGNGAGVKVNDFPSDLDWEKAKAAAGTRVGEILLRVGRASRIAQSRFMPKPYQGDAVVFMASDREVTRYEDEFLGWKPLVLGKLENFEVKGTHITIFLDPAVRAMAEKIDAKLRETSTEVSSA